MFYIRLIVVYRLTSNDGTSDELSVVLCATFSTRWGVETNYYDRKSSDFGLLGAAQPHVPRRNF